MLVQCESQGEAALPLLSLSAKHRNRAKMCFTQIQPVPWPQDGRDSIDVEQKFPYLRELKHPVCHSAAREGERPHPDQALSTCSAPQVK